MTTEIRFINRELAEADGKRFAVLQARSDESRIESWFALQAIADQVGPASNVGKRGMHWEPAKTSASGAVVMGATYHLVATCVDGMIRTSTGAPKTLEAARQEKNLAKPMALLQRLIKEKGGLRAPNRRPSGTSQALEQALAATPEGKAWLAAHRRPGPLLLSMVKVADEYGREGIYPSASLEAHVVFLPYEEDRIQLVREFSSGRSARGRALSLRPTAIRNDKSGGPRGTSVSPRRVTQLAVRAGVPLDVARGILRGKANGVPKTRYLRAINMAYQDDVALKAA